MDIKPDHKAALNESLGDLRAFLRQAEAEHELHVVKGADPHLELGAIYELSQEPLYPPALLFEEMKGCDPRFRVLCNVRNPRFVVGDLTKSIRKKWSDTLPFLKGGD